MVLLVSFITLATAFLSAWASPVNKRATLSQLEDALATLSDHLVIADNAVGTLAQEGASAWPAYSTATSNLLAAIDNVRNVASTIDSIAESDQDALLNFTQTAADELMNYLFDLINIQSTVSALGEEPTVHSQVFELAEDTSQFLGGVLSLLTTFPQIDQGQTIEGNTENGIAIALDTYP